MSIVWLFSAALLTQYPEGFLERPEVKAFLGPPRVVRENVARMPRGFVVGLMPQYDRASEYFVLDASERVDVETTKRLNDCLPAASRAKHPQLIVLAGGRGVVVEGCLVDGTEVLPVVDLWGPGWQRLTSQNPPQLADEAIARFRASRDYQQLVREVVPARPAPVHLPNSPYDLVHVFSSRVDAISGQPLSKLFVIGENGGPTQLELTAELGRQVRSELVATCGAMPLSLSPGGEGVIIATETWGRGEEGSVSCEVLALWKRGALVVTTQTVSPDRHQESLRESLRTAERLFAAGDVAGAISTWESVLPQLPDGGDRSAGCRDLARAYERADEADQARRVLEECSELPTNRGETLLLLAELVWRHREPVLALAHLEHALALPLGDPDRRMAQAAVIRIELELAEAAAQAGQRTAARLHYQHLLQTPLADAQAAKVKHQLRRLK